MNLAMKLLVPVVGLVCSLNFARAETYDAIVRGGRIVDGTGNPAFFADIALKDGRIAAIGQVHGDAKEEIDLHGLIVAPGFIDMLGQSEQFVLIDPRAMSKVMMGVTTEITGEGESIAPVNDRIL